MDKEHTQFYGRRLGRALKGAREKAHANLMPQLCLKDDVLLENGQLDANRYFKNPTSQLWMEIGFGGGEQLLHWLGKYPEHNYIGIEPYINGMAGFLADIDAAYGKAPENLAVYNDDAMRVARSLKDNSLDRLYVLNPDPWHKKRHHKRRMIGPSRLDVFARILKPGGLLIAATDVDELAEWMITHLSNHPAFEWTAENASDWRTRPDSLIDTRYALKGAKGSNKRQTYLVFKKVLPAPETE